MTVIQYPFERRRRRSGNAYQAIRFQLEHIFENQGLDSFVLGDSRGLVLAQAGDSFDSSVLAAFAPLIYNHRGSQSRKHVVEKVVSMMPDSDLEGLTIRAFEIDGETLYLCSLGANTMPREAGVYRAVTGIRRILEQSAA